MFKRMICSLLMLAGTPFSVMAADDESSKAQSYESANSQQSGMYESNPNQPHNPQAMEQGFHPQLDPDGKIEAGEDGLPLIH